MVLTSALIRDISIPIGPQLDICWKTVVSSPFPRPTNSRNLQLYPSTQRHDDVVYRSVHWSFFTTRTLALASLHLYVVILFSHRNSQQYERSTLNHQDQTAIQ